MTDDELAELLSGLAHDLRSPLTSIRGFTDVLIKGGDRLSDAQRQDFLARIAAAGAKLDGLLTDLSAAARKPEPGA